MPRNPGYKLNTEFSGFLVEVLHLNHGKDIDSSGLIFSMVDELEQQLELLLKSFHPES